MFTDSPPRTHDGGGVEATHEKILSSGYAHRMTAERLDL